MDRKRAFKGKSQELSNMTHQRRIGAPLILLIGAVSWSQDEQFTDQDLEVAERFIDAFYSFDPERLRAMLYSAEASMPPIIYYQGWAEGGNYSVVEKHGCEVREDKIVCPVTVKDDLMAALRIDFDVTDSFHLSVSEGQIHSVETSSNDLEVFREAEAWVWKERPELVAAPCAGYWDDGETPGDCVRAMVSGYRQYTETDEYAEHVSNLVLPD
jgi:hypothetical protein